MKKGLSWTWEQLHTKKHLTKLFNTSCSTRTYNKSGQEYIRQRGRTDKIKWWEIGGIRDEKKKKGINQKDSPSHLLCISRLNKEEHKIKNLIVSNNYRRTKFIANKNGRTPSQWRLVYNRCRAPKENSQ